VACAYGRVKIVELFNKYSDRFDLNIAGETGTLPIDYALDNDQLIVVKELYKIKNDFNKNEHLNTAISKNCYGIVNYLLSSGVKPTVESLSQSTYCNSPELFRLLLEYQDINTSRLSLIDTILARSLNNEFLFKENNRGIVFGKSTAKLHTLDNESNDTLLEESLSEGTERLTSYLVRKLAAELHKSEHAKYDITGLKKDLTLEILSAIYTNGLPPKMNYELLKKIRMVTNDGADGLRSYIQSLKLTIIENVFSSPHNVVLDNLIEKIDLYKSTQANKPTQSNI